MLRNSSRSHSQTGNLFTGVSGFVFGLRYPNDVHMPCLSYDEREDRGFCSATTLYTQLGRKERDYTQDWICGTTTQRTPVTEMDVIFSSKLLSVSHMPL